MTCAVKAMVLPGTQNIHITLSTKCHVSLAPPHFHALLTHAAMG